MIGQEMRCLTSHNAGCSQAPYARQDQTRGLRATLSLSLSLSIGLGKGTAHCLSLLFLLSPRLMKMKRRIGSHAIPLVRHPGHLSCFGKRGAGWGGGGTGGRLAIDTASISLPPHPGRRFSILHELISLCPRTRWWTWRYPHLELEHPPQETTPPIHQAPFINCGQVDYKVDRASGTKRCSGRQRVEARGPKAPGGLVNRVF